MVAPLGGGDKYAALADLDSVFGATSSGLPVNWDASFGGGGRESWAGGGQQATTSNGVTASTPATGALLSCLVLCALVWERDKPGKGYCGKSFSVIFISSVGISFRTVKYLFL